jgi:2-dehydro-3-deoxyphosphogluconate aldolase/(4S)-4-hydroxy-2-oxoglutarate aldolase
MREETIAAIEKEKIIAIVRGAGADALIPLTQAMYDGGIRLIEIAYDAGGGTSDGETARRIALLAERFGGKMRIGAGTVLREEQAALTHAAGGTFVISPDTYAPVIEKTRALGMVSIPGAMTPTEIQTAHRLGADFIKIFPAGTLGAEYVRAVRAPLPHVKLLAVGGVNAENMKRFLDAGAVGFGIGSGITDGTAIREKDYEKITALARKYTEAARA